MRSSNGSQMPVQFEFRVPAIEVTQSPGRVLYTFAVDGKAVHSFATISRIRRAEASGLSGYQRPEVLKHIAEIRSLLADGALGEIVTVTADHGQCFEEDPEFRLFAPKLGGGALLDLGVYPVSFASMVLGRPDRIVTLIYPAFTGVDGQTSMLFGAIPPFLLKTDDNPEGVDVRYSSTTSTSSRRTGSASRHGRRASRSSRADPPESSATQAYEACGEAPAATLRPRGRGSTQELDVVLGSGLEHKT